MDQNTDNVTKDMKRVHIVVIRRLVKHLKLDDQGNKKEGEVDEDKDDDKQGRTGGGVEGAAAPGPQKQRTP
jgi:hypothetical protein